MSKKVNDQNQINASTQRRVFFVSDGTGITAESLGNSLLSQFKQLSFVKKTIPFVDSLERVKAVVKEINTSSETNNLPIVFDTLVNRKFRAELAQANAFFIDIFGTFLQPLEKEFKTHSNHRIGGTHGIQELSNYKNRIEAINFTLADDDGKGSLKYDKADLILTGVSRSGKTPTSLYLALQFGLYIANYPLIEADLESLFLPKVLRPYRNKLFGLTIEEKRLANIREQRRPKSQYASLKQCREELNAAEQIYINENIPFLDSTYKSIEELASRIMAITDIKRR